MTNWTTNPNAFTIAFSAWFWCDLIIVLDREQGICEEDSYGFESLWRIRFLVSFSSILFIFCHASGVFIQIKEKLAQIEKKPHIQSENASKLPLWVDFDGPTLYKYSILFDWNCPFLSTSLLLKSKCVLKDFEL